VVYFTPETRAAAKRAADWLKANPDKHIGFRLAEAANGTSVPPTSVFADCFCAVGRLACELNSSDYHGVYRAIGSTETDDLYSANDSGIRTGDRSKGLNALYRVARGQLP